MDVPFVDLHAQYQTIKTEIDSAIASVISSSSFIRGPEVAEFEEAFSKAVGPTHCVSCANGTDAIYIALHTLGVKPGDEVIVPAMSWVSTSETVTQAGGKVVFCDIDPMSYTLDPARLAQVITDRTVGIIPVHLYGQPADMDPIMDVAERHGLWIVEDCAQAHLASYKGRKVGAFGIAATFSFYPGKNLGAMGDAGAILTSNEGLAQRMAMFARHGGLVKGDHQIEGINSRLDGIQAAILSVKLRYLDRWTSRRKEVAAAYESALSSITALDLPKTGLDRDHVWHLYVIQCDDRDGLAAHLRRAGIQTSINYPRALPQLPCYAHMHHAPDDFPVSQRLADRGLALPIFPEMTLEQINHVVAAVDEFMSELSA